MLVTRPPGRNDDRRPCWLRRCGPRTTCLGRWCWFAPPRNRSAPSTSAWLKPLPARRPSPSTTPVSTRPSAPPAGGPKPYSPRLRPAVRRSPRRNCCSGPLNRWLSPCVLLPPPSSCRTRRARSSRRRSMPQIRRPSAWTRFAASRSRRCRCWLRCAAPTGRWLCIGLPGRHCSMMSSGRAARRRCWRRCRLRGRIA